MVFKYSFFYNLSPIMLFLFLFSHVASVLAELERFPKLKRQYKEMIERIEKRPHLYTPYEREETTNQHVARWLTSTSGKENQS